MKFKKEYRWLLFLVIPFVLFMFVLFMAPLEVILNAQPLITQQYNLRKHQMKQDHLRSTSYLAHQQLSNHLRSTFAPLFAI